MLQGKKPEFADFTPHPEGRFNGIVYCFKAFPRRGEIDNWGNATKHKCMLRIESMDVTIDDPDSDYHGKPQSVGIFFNYSYGDDTKRSGTFYPAMQENREVILDRKMTEEEWYNFDPNELMGIRVRYRVSHDPKENPKSENDVWVNAKVIERLEDQDVGTQINETEVDVEAILTGAIAGADGDVRHTKAQTSAPATSDRNPPPKPAPPKPGVTDSIHPKARDYAKAVVALLFQEHMFDEKGAKTWIDFIEDEKLSPDEFRDQYLALEQSAREAEIDLPQAVVHPLSSGEDDLPL